MAQKDEELNKIIYDDIPKTFLEASRDSYAIHYLSPKGQLA